VEAVLTLKRPLTLLGVNTAIFLEGLAKTLHKRGVSGKFAVCFLEKYLKSIKRPFVSGSFLNVEQF